MGRIPFFNFRRKETENNSFIFSSNEVNEEITKIEEYKEQISHLVSHDYLTDLPNRVYFEQKIESLIESVKDRNNRFSILYLDLDRFRHINESLGHGFGNELLKAFSNRIKDLLYGKYLFARIGGNEFGIILWEYKNEHFPVQIATSIIDCLKEAFFIEEYEVLTSTSVGICTFPTNGKTVDELVRNAEAALYRAKDNGRNSYQIYSSSLHITSLKLHYYEQDLRKSIENQQLVVHFQPRVDAKTGMMVSAEALVRWEHPVWGMVSPKEFIPLAEKIGFINEIGDWVLEQVCQFLKESKREKLKVVPISINISSQRFIRNDWESTITQILKEHEIEPKLIEFEITETTIIKHEQVVESALQFLKELGVKIALDDFGTGFSSLSYVKNFAIDTIKIDKSFIDQITKEENVDVIIKSMISMAKGLHMNIVAEGVETMEQLSFLKQHECNEIQGYIYSKPLPEEQFHTLLKEPLLTPIHDCEKCEIANKRNYYRLELVYPLGSWMSLISIQGKSVSLGKTEVLIENIGPGGLRFLSTMDLPVRPDIHLQMETRVMGQSIRLIGHVVWKEEIKDIFQYGLELIIDDENERDDLIKVLNNFSTQLRKNSIVSDCSFIKEEKFAYLKNAAQS